LHADTPRLVHISHTLVRAICGVDRFGTRDVVHDDLDRHATAVNGQRYPVDETGRVADQIVDRGGDFIGEGDTARGRL
jgi:hypothetical protein